MARLLYITSSAHSGSTLTDLLIGTLPRAVSTGELKHLPHLLSNRHDDTTEDGNACSCLNSLAKCPFWSRVVDRLVERTGIDIWSAPTRFNVNLMCGHYQGRRRSLRRKFEPRGVYGHVIQHRIWRWIQPLWNALYRRRVRNNWLLFDTIARVAGAEVVVDSSKDIRRLNMLCTHRRDDVSVIMLMRSLPGCAHSAARRKRTITHYAKSWVRHNNRIYRLLRQMPDLPVLPLQYENLVCDPVAARRRIARFLGLPDPGESIDIDTHNYHLIRGNRLRYAGQVEISPRDRWQDKTDDETLRMFRTIAVRLHPGLLEMGLDPFATFSPGPENPGSTTSPDSERTTPMASDPR
ncbi:MAG: sulfotransferase [Planctomycetota bacterium]